MGLLVAAVVAIVLTSGATVVAAVPQAPPPPPPPEPVAHVRMALVDGLDAVAPQPATFPTPLSAQPAPAVDVTALPPGAWLHGALSVLKTESIPFAVSADRSTLFFDADRDGRLEPHEGAAPLPGSTPGSRSFRVEGPVRETVGSKLHEERLRWLLVVPLRSDTAIARLDCHRRGEVSVGGRKATIGVVDQTFRGWFSHLGRDLLVVDVDGDGRLDGSPDSNERFRLGQPFPLGEMDLIVSEVAPLGTSLAVARSQRPAQRRASLRVGTPAPDFELARIDGATFSLAGARGKWVYLDFWATWCGPCRQELPYLKAARAAHPELVVMGVSGDRSREALQQYVTREHVDWPQGWDSDGRVSTLYRVSSLPRSLLLAPDGTIAAKDLRGPLLSQLIATTMAARPAGAATR